MMHASTTGHWIIFHASGNVSPNPYAEASPSAMCPPATTNPSARMIKTDKAMVKPIATSRCFHHGRLSVRSYAVLSDSVIALSPLDAAQSAASIPNDSLLPVLDFETSHIVLSINSNADGGMMRAR